MDIKNIAIIGCGNLGRRHLQSAVKCKYPVSIYVYDINVDVFKLAEEIVKNEKMQPETTVNYITSMNELPKELFVVVVASSASGRAETVKTLLSNSTVDYLILEKVLFQKYDDYDEIETLLSEKKVTTFVNCPRRYYPIYSKIKENLDGKKFSFYLHGGNWGLACNFIHYLDLLSYIADNENVEVNLSALDNEIIDSKRQGYKEITGSVTGRIGRCKNFNIVSEKNSENNTFLIFESEDEKIVILEAENLMYVIKNDVIKCEKFDIFFQSQLTQKYIESLIESGNCLLTKYEESSSLHKAFIKPLTEYFAERGEKNRLCPIT